MSDCRTPDRNYCTPDGKNAALFVDLDGTTVVCEPYFKEAAANFAHYLALRGFDQTQATELFKEFNHKVAEAHGFELDVFARSMIECYRHIVDNSRRRVKPEQRVVDEQILKAIGMGPYFRKPEVFPNAIEVLNRAYHSFLIFFVSIGNREAQKYKVRRAGLSIHDDMIFTSRDDKAEIVSQVIEDWNISPNHSAFIGNSKRSDGACLALTNFLYLPLEGGWAFDNAVGLPENSPFKVLNARDWREAEEKGINRLLRQRKRATPATHNAASKGDCCKK